MSTPEERLSVANTEKAEADARKASAEADKAAREVAVILDSELDRRKQEAEAEKAIAEARKATADADRARLSALIPDLGDMSRGETTITTEQPLFSAVLAHRALGDAAGVMKTRLEGKLGEGVTLLTSDPDLATSDAVYLDVRTGLDQLSTAADKLLAAAKPEAGLEEAAEAQGDKEALGAGAVTGALGAAVGGPAGMAAGALAAAVPSVLSLLSAHRSISTYPATVDDTAALAAVGGALAEWKVKLDDFRLVPEGEITEAASELQTRRSQLVELKLTQDQTRSRGAAVRSASEERIRELNAQLDKAREKGLSVEDILRSIKEEKEARDLASMTEKRSAVFIGLIESALSTIDAFVAKLTTVPAGGKRSPLAAAALREQFRSNGDAKISKVLLVKAASGSVAQLLNDRPLWFKDRFMMIGSVSVSYVLIDPSDSTVEAAGQAPGTASVKGTIGKEFTISSGAF